MELMIGGFHGKNWPKIDNLVPQVKAFTAKPDDPNIPRIPSREGMY